MDDIYRKYKKLNITGEIIPHNEFVKVCITKSGRKLYKYLYVSWISGNPDEFMIIEELYRKLPSDLDFQSYYDIVVLGLESPSDRPKCIHCDDNCESKFKPPVGYLGYCSKSKCRYSHTGVLISKKLKGRPLSEQNKQSLSKVKKGKKWTDKDREARPGFTMKGRRHKLETRLKMSLSRRNQIISNAPLYKSGEMKSSKCSVELHYMSSYERDFIKLCDSSKFISKIEVPEPILYSYSGEFHMYYPDFLITTDSGKKVLVEIKPISLVNTKLVITKRLYGRKWCRENDAVYVTLTQRDIYKNKKGTPKEINYSLRIYDYFY